jgi:CheY-like chemotaxis protein
VTTLALLVNECGHDARTAYDGSSVLEAALDYRPHVVLLDIGLPGLNGFEVAKQLRQQPALQNVVLVAMTGYGREGDRQRSQEAGFDHHLVKPGDFGKVLQILASVSELLAK